MADEPPDQRKPEEHVPAHAAKDEPEYVPAHAASDEPESWLRGLSVRRRIFLIVAFLALAAFAVYLVIRAGDLAPGNQGSARSAPRPVEGVACDHLAEANRAHAAGDRAAFAASVNAAGDAADRSLDTSGQLFGPPEEAALELRYALEDEGMDGPNVERFLREGEEACRAIGA